MSTEKKFEKTRFKFGLKSLFAMMIILALLIAGVGAVLRLRVTEELARHLKDPTKWPEPFQDLLEKNLVTNDRVKAYELCRFLDDCVVVSFSNCPEAVEELIREFQLRACDRTHPLANHLLKSVPKEWDKPLISDCNWYTSQGFGTVHMEGQDLFLIATDSKSGITLILYNWVF